MHSELKSCPFCGGEAELTSRRVNSGQTLYRYRCASCHAAIGRWHGGISGHDYTAAETWNTRAERTCHIETKKFPLSSVPMCSECGRFWLDKDSDNYCPNCGAKVVSE